jgi:hypothetical protein
VHSPRGAAELPAAFLAKHGDRVVVGFASMDDHRPVELARQAQLRPEHGLLHVARREIMVVVETDLAHRARGWRRRTLLAHDSRGPAVPAPLLTEAATWDFAVDPPFYRTPSFFMLTLLAIASLVAAAWWMRIRAAPSK